MSSIGILSVPGERWDFILPKCKVSSSRVNGFKLKITSSIIGEFNNANKLCSFCGACQTWFAKYSAKHWDLDSLGCNLPVRSFTVGTDGE